jgi:hypothetical protein
MRLSFDDEESFKDVVGSLRFDNPPSDPNSVAMALQEVGSSGVRPQERNEDICFNDDSPSDPNSLGGVDSTPPQKRSDIEIVAAWYYIIIAVYTMIPNLPRTLFMFTNYHSLNLETKKKFGSAEAFVTVSTFLTSSKAVTMSTAKPY